MDPPIRIHPWAGTPTESFAPSVSYISANYYHEDGIVRGTFELENAQNWRIVDYSENVILTGTSDDTSFEFEDADPNLEYVLQFQWSEDGKWYSEPQLDFTLFREEGLE